MATLTHHRLLSAILGVLFSTLITVNAARPCKTLLISSYSISFRPNPNFINPNPNFIKNTLLQNLNSIDDTNFDLIFSRHRLPIQYQNHRPESLGHDDIARIFTSSSLSSPFSVPRFMIRGPKLQVFPEFPQFRTEHEQRELLRLLHGDDVVNADSVVGLFDSLRDRTKDVLSVVLALLFGVGCGALTAGTMYFVYAVCRGSVWSRYGDYDSDDEEGDIFSPKKGGYVMVPSKAEVSTPVKQVDIVVEPLVNKD